MTSFARFHYAPKPKYIEKDITICLHNGFDRNIVDKQMSLLEPLKNEFNIHWNNRIDRHPETYETYSEMINEAVCTSPTETVILISDKSIPTVKEVLFMLQMLDRGFAAVSLCSVRFMGVTKELFRKVGWWDQRFIGGGYEDDDFILRLRLANLAYFESLSSEYDVSIQSPLQVDGHGCALSEPHFRKKWIETASEIRKVIPEESYPKWDSMIGNSRPDISSRWLDWSHTIAGIDYGRKSSDADSRTYHFALDDYKTEYRTVASDC
tara:strand:- start:554 stop:1351 length:798 start_codon:yes stop_codon:yes gene_type:complete